MKPDIRALLLAAFAFVAGCSTPEPPPEPPSAPRYEKLPEVEQSLREACEGGEWYLAAKICRRRLGSSKNPLVQLENGTRLAIANWNAGDRLSAVIAMDAVVTVSAPFGDDCTRMAEIFRNAFRARAVPEKFTVAEAMGETGPCRVLVDLAKSELARAP